MSCSCGTCNGCLSTDTISIPTGADGQNGINGVFGGFSGSWLFNSSTSTGPDATYLRFNEVDLTTATELYISDTNADSLNYDNFLASFENSGSYGTVRIWKRYDSTIFWIGTITSVTDNGTDYTYGITFLENNNSFETNDELVVSFTASGANGADGTGSSGASIIYATNNIDTDAGTAGGPFEFASVPITANLLGADGDTLELELYYTTDDVDNLADNYYLSFGSDGYPTSSNEEYANWREFGTKGALIRSRITRLSSVKAQCETSVFFTKTATGSAISLAPDASKCRINSFNVNFDATEANLLQYGFVGSTTQLNNLITSIVVKYVPYQAL